MSTFTKLDKECPCDRKKQDCFARYSDGSGHCFHATCEKPNGHWSKKALEKAEAGENMEVKKPAADSPLVKGEFKDIPSRQISKETCERFGYMIGRYKPTNDDKGKLCHVAQWFGDNNEVVGQKVRFVDKTFTTVGDTTGLFGMHVWKNTKNKTIVITEGELDALSFAEATGCNVPCVSIPNGAQSASRSISAVLPYLEERFDRIIIAFDQDKEGKAASEKVVKLFSPKKCYIAELSEKDINELLIKGKTEEIRGIISSAKPYRPSGIVTWNNLSESLTKPLEPGLSYPFQKLTDLTMGIRLREIITLGAGTGIGKSAIAREILLHLREKHDKKVALFAFEENVEFTQKLLCAKAVRKNLCLPSNKLSEDELFRGADIMYGVDKETDPRLFLYKLDNEPINWEHIKIAINHLVKVEGVEYIFLDNLTAIAASIDDKDERRALDRIMRDMATLVHSKEFPFTLFLISHLSRPSTGPAHEEGGRVSLNHFRGSGSIVMWSHIVFGIERDQQDSEDRNKSELRILKDRFTGQAVGYKIGLKFNLMTSEIVEETVSTFDVTEHLSSEELGF